MNTHCLKKSTLIFVSMIIFSLNLSASELFEDVIFHVEANTQNATEPGLRCAEVTPVNFYRQMSMSGKAIVDSPSFGAATNPNCEYEFSMDYNGTAQSELQFTTPGIQDAYFYVKGPTANATPLGACPFEVNIIPIRGRKREMKKSSF